MLLANIEGTLSCSPTGGFGQAARRVGGRVGGDGSKAGTKSGPRSSAADSRGMARDRRGMARNRGISCDACGRPMTPAAKTLDTVLPRLIGPQASAFSCPAALCLPTGRAVPRSPPAHSIPPASIRPIILPLRDCNRRADAEGCELGRPRRRYPDVETRELGPPRRRRPDAGACELGRPRRRCPHVDTRELGRPRRRRPHSEAGDRGRRQRRRLTQDLANAVLSWPTLSRRSSRTRPSSSPTP